VLSVNTVEMIHPDMMHILMNKAATV